MRSWIQIIFFFLFLPAAHAAFDFIISGGGPTGLATAVSLRARGYKVLVVEARDTNVDWGTRQQTIALTSESEKILAGLNVGQSLVAKIDRFSFFRDSKQVQEGQLFEVKNGTIMQGLLYFFYRHRPNFLVEIGDLERALLAEFQKMGGELLFRSEIKEVADGTLLISTPEGNRTEKYSWLIDAEGTHSKMLSVLAVERQMKAIRKAIFIKGRWKNARGAEVRYALLPSGQNSFDSSVYYTKGIGFTLGIDLIGAESTAINHFYPELIFRQLGIHPQDVEAFSVSVIDVEQSHLERFYYPQHNIIVVGDAAHTASPFTGLGLNLGIREAEMLDRLFAKAADVSKKDLEYFERAMIKNTDFLLELDRRYYDWVQLLLHNNSRIMNGFYKTLGHLSCALSLRRR